MPPVPSEEYLERFRAALRLEIKAEMGRRDLSAHGLAVRVGGNPQYVNMRILTGNKKTGRFVDINVSDLAKFAGALEVDPVDLVRRAKTAAADDLAARRTAKQAGLWDPAGYLVASDEPPAPDEGDET